MPSSVKNFMTLLLMFVIVGGQASLLSMDRQELFEPGSEAPITVISFFNESIIPTIINLREGMKKVSVFGGDIRVRGDLQEKLLTQPCVKGDVAIDTIVPVFVRLGRLFQAVFQEAFLYDWESRAKIVSFLTQGSAVNDVIANVVVRKRLAQTLLYTIKKVLDAFIEYREIWRDGEKKIKWVYRDGFVFTNEMNNLLFYVCTIFWKEKLLPQKSWTQKDLKEQLLVDVAFSIRYNLPETIPAHVFSWLSKVPMVLSETFVFLLNALFEYGVRKHLVHKETIRLAREFTDDMFDEDLEICFRDFNDSDFDEMVRYGWTLADGSYEAIFHKPVTTWMEPFCESCVAFL